MSPLRDIDVEPESASEPESDPAGPTAGKNAPPAASDAAVPVAHPRAPRGVGTLRRIAEEEFIVILLLATFGLIFFLVFPPFLLVNDSWMTLVSGREIADHGLPHHDALTVLGHGRTWIDQQWGAQLLLYGMHALGGFPLLAVVDCVIVLAAFAIAIAGARALGAGPRAIWVLFLPVLIAAPWAWTIRAQLFALPLYTGLLWLLTAEARRPSRRVYLAFPLLVLWANLHGSVVLGALLTMLLGAIELVRSRGHGWLRATLLLVVPPLAVLATPYGPVTTTRYYWEMLVAPPFDHHITEWMWSKPEWKTLVFYLLGAAAVPLVVWGRKRLTPFDVAVLVLTFAGAVEAIRGIPWFALASMILLPVAIATSLERKRPAPVFRRLNTVLAAGAAAVLVGLAVVSLLRNPSWYEQEWQTKPVEAVQGALEPGTRVFAPDVFSDWLLWKIPELRGRVAYDVRFEIYSKPFFDRLLRYNGEYGRNWKAFANGYRIVVVDEGERSHTADFLSEPGARELYHDKDVTVILRPKKER